MARWIEQPDQGLAEFSGIGTYEWRVAEDELRWSSSLLKIYGLEKPPSAECDFTIRVHPDDRIRVEAETASYMGSGDAYLHEFRIVRPDGEIRHVLDKGIIERNATGAVVVMRGLNIDVTEHRRDRRTTEAGHEGVAYFGALADNMSQLAWLADKSGSIYWYNQRWFEFTGTQLSEMKGWGWTKVHHPDHVERVVARIAHSFETGEPWEDTFPLRCSDGTYSWFLSRAIPIRDELENVLCWFGTNTDITAIRDAEQLLAESEERFRALAESMPQLVWTASSDGRVDYYNSRIALYSRGDGVDHDGLRWQGILHPEDLTATAEAWRAAADHAADYSFAHRLRMADGTYRWHLSRAVPIRGADKHLRWFGTATDIHELREAQEHRQVLTDELVHRVKNTLALVQSVARMTFREGESSTKQVKLFESRLKAMAGAHDILTQKKWQEAPLKDLIERAILSCGAVRDRFTLSGDDASLSAHHGVIVSMAIHELCTNAMKYGSLSADRGTVEIRWRAVESAFRLAWNERGGPAVSRPNREGFGSRLLKQALAGQLNATVVMNYHPDGLECVVERQP